MRKYILNPDHTFRPTDDMMEWGMWFENPENRRIAQDSNEKYRVSTVFLGLDHNFLDEGNPILFETMVFGEESDEDREMERYHTYDEAVEGHKRICQKYLK